MLNRLKSNFQILLCVFFVLNLNTITHSAPINGVIDFKIDRYLGKWYEIARSDHFFERGLSNVTATYSLINDKKIKVINTGYSQKKNKIKEVTGKAIFKFDPSIGHLKVSFFGPFYSDYIIFKIDQNYKYAYVSDKKGNLIWLLSREPNISKSIKSDFLKTLNKMKISTKNIIWVDHTKNDI
jgi:apolipoprotein D and lipocalin family protein